MSTSNVHNHGIMHWTPKPGGPVACGTNRAIMATTGDKLKDWGRVCRKCLGKYNSALSREAARTVVSTSPPERPIKGKPFTIDMTPSWAGVLPIYLEALESRSSEARKGAREELLRMAKLADAYVAAQKAGQVA